MPRQIAAERLTAKAAYVACSRGQVSCVVHTPDKTALLARLPDGNREAALDLLGADHSLARKALDRTLAWAQSATARDGILSKLMRKIASRILGVKRSPQPCPLQTVDQLRQHLAYYNSPAMDTRHDIGPSQGL